MDSFSYAIHPPYKLWLGWNDAGPSGKGADEQQI